MSEQDAREVEELKRNAAKRLTDFQSGFEPTPESASKVARSIAFVWGVATIVFIVAAVVYSAMRDF